MPIGIDDFSAGGLDLFHESYVQADTVRTIRSGEVVGKKGEVAPEYLAGIIPLIRK
jgi:hypothetical protein